MLVIATPHLTEAAALAVRKGNPVLVLRDGLLSAADLRLVRGLLGGVSARVDDTLLAAATVTPP